MRKYVKNDVLFLGVFLILACLMLAGCQNIVPANNDDAVVDDSDLGVSDVESFEDSVQAEDQDQVVMGDVEDAILQDQELLDQEDIIYVPGDSGKVMLSDTLYEYNSREYHYDDDSFGVVDVNYDGPAKHMDTGDSFNMRVYGFISYPNDAISLEINYDNDKYEVTGLLSEGDYYITRDGIKIQIDSIQGTKFAFTLTKMNPAEHTELCSDCIKRKDLREDDGVMYVRTNKETAVSYKGQIYKFTVYSINSEKNELRLQVNIDDVISETLPVLYSGQTYVLKNGQPIRFLFAAVSEWANQEYAYATIGFVNSYELPDVAYCDTCELFMNYADGDTRAERIDGKTRTTKLQVREGNVVFNYDGAIKPLKFREFVELGDGVWAILVTKNVPYTVGLKIGDGKYTKMFCKELDDEGADYDVQGSITAAIAKETNKFERTDVCLDDSTLAEYSCEPVPDKAHDGSSGSGFRAVLEQKSCACEDGACVR